MEKRHAAAEAHWLQEVDRARQMVKERDKQLRELRAQLQATEREIVQLSRKLTEVQSDLKAAVLLREQLERSVSRNAASGRLVAKASAQRRGSAKSTGRRASRQRV